LGYAWVKAVSKKVVKSTLGYFFNDILQTAFMHPDHKSTKKTDSLTVFFALLGYAGV
jgi:hypothetical protein